MNADITRLAKTALIEELEGLRDEVRRLAESLDEKELWTKPLEPGNSIGHLVLHLTGNLNHFVGAQLGGSGYVRDREGSSRNPIDRPGKRSWRTSMLPWPPFAAWSTSWMPTGWPRHTRKLGSARCSRPWCIWLHTLLCTAGR